MNTNRIYWPILLLILSAWLSDIQIKIAPASKPKETIEPGESHKDLKSLGLENKKLTAGGNCNIEYMNRMASSTSVFQVKKDTGLQIIGWGLDINNNRLPTDVIIQFKGKNDLFFSKAKTGISRPDVKSYFSINESLTNSGYETNAKLSDFPVGEYGLTTILNFADTAYVCDNGRRIDVQ